MSSNGPEVITLGGSGGDIGRMLSEVLTGQSRNTPPRGIGDLTEENVLEKLSERCAAYIRSYGVNEYSEHPFKVGQFVTPRLGVALKGAGTPHVVLETRQATAPDFQVCDETGPSSNGYGCRRDVRCSGISNGVMVSHWMESYELTEYTAGSMNAPEAAFND